MAALSAMQMDTLVSEAEVAKSKAGRAARASSEGSHRSSCCCHALEREPQITFYTALTTVAG